MDIYFWTQCTCQSRSRCTTIRKLNNRWTFANIHEPSWIFISNNDYAAHHSLLATWSWKCDRNLAFRRLIFPWTNSLSCQPKWEHRNTTFLTINELPKPATIPNLATEPTSDDSDWIHSSINRAECLHRSSKMVMCYKVVIEYRMEYSGYAFLHVTPKLLILLSSSDHNSQPYQLWQYIWNSLVIHLHQSGQVEV